MNKKEELDAVVNERKRLQDIIKRQENHLLKMDALKRTFVKAMVSNNLCMALPIYNYTKQGTSVIRIKDEYPLFIINIGEVVSLLASYTIPINFKVLRYFKKSQNNMKAGEYTWYTTSVLSKNDEIYLYIQDDENNIWKGPHAFVQLYRSFDGGMPFSNAVQWLGADKEEVQTIISAQESYKKLLKSKSGESGR